MFNLITLVKAIEKIGKAMPNCNTTVLSNIYQLNELPDIKYSVFCITQEQHRQDDEYFYFNFVLYYVDRLLNDKSNQLEIQSTGIQFLSTVLGKIEDLGLILNTDWQTTYQSFTQRFADECAGVFARVQIQVPIDCSVPYDVLVDPLLGDIDISLPGTYSPRDFGLDAFSSVKVEGEIPDIWVKKVPTPKTGTSAQTVDYNDITESGYYRITAQNYYTVNGPFESGWQPDGTLHVIADEWHNHIVQILTFTLIGGITWPRMWWRVRGWNGYSEHMEWSVWKECADDSNAVMKDPKVIEGTSANTVDFNDIEKTGYYFVRGNWDWTVNGPKEHLMDGILQVVMKDGWNGLQIYTTIDPDRIAERQRTFIRYMAWGREWRKWLEITTDGEIQTLQPTSSNTINFNHYSASTKNYFIKASGNEDYLQNAPVKSDGMLEVISRASENDILQRYTTTWLPPRAFMRTYGYDSTMQKNRWSNWWEFTLTEMEGTEITQGNDHILPDPQIGGEWDDPDPHAQPNSNGIGAKCLYTDVLEDNEGAHLWTIQDAKDGDVLVGNEDGVILMFRGIGNTEWDDVIDYHCYYDCHREDLIIQEDVEYWGNIENNKLKPATKEQCDLLFQKMKELGYEWDAEKKELKKQKNKSNKETIKPLKAYLEKQKPVEWSEEDDL